MRNRWVRGAAVSMFFLAVACGGGNNNNAGTSPTATESESPSGGAGTVEVTEKDFSVATNPTSASAGAITFDVHNEGPSVHEFVVFETDLAPDALPTNADGTVNEEGEGVTHIDEIEDIPVGEEQDLEVDLEAGNYVLICNLPGHYKSGMHTGFTVS